MTFGKKVALWAILAAVLYALMGYHYIFEGLSVPWVLKKSHWTLNYTFFSIHGKTNEAIVAIDELRQDCLLYTSPSPRDLSTSRMPSSA